MQQNLSILKHLTEVFDKKSFYLKFRNIHNKTPLLERGSSGLRLFQKEIPTREFSCEDCWILIRPPILKNKNMVTKVWSDLKSNSQNDKDLKPSATRPKFHRETIYTK